MKRLAFAMKLKPGMISEYKKRHDEIWPELKTLLKQAGISEYSIFFDEQTHILFAYQRVTHEGSQHLSQEEVVQKWWSYMADLMEVNPDNSPVTVELKEVFYLP